MIDLYNKICYKSIFLIKINKTLQSIKQMGFKYVFLELNANFRYHTPYF